MFKRHAHEDVETGRPSKHHIPSKQEFFKSNAPSHVEYNNISSGS